jgi:hypothetical protein
MEVLLHTFVTSALNGDEKSFSCLFHFALREGALDIN